MTPQQPISNETSTGDLRAATVQPEGDLVSTRVAVLRSRLRDVVASGVLRLTVDLADVRLVDSAGIGLLVAAHNSLKNSGGELAVIHASKDVLDLLRTMRIHQHFSVSGN